MYKLYDYLSSGNSYKVRLLLALRGIAYERIDTDIMTGQTRTDQFLKRNPNGRIPTLQLDDGQFLWESNAILYYLAQDTHYLSTTRLQTAQILQWLFFEQYSHEPNIAVVRFWRMHGQMDSDRQSQLKQKMKGGYAALAVMENHLQNHTWFVGDRMSIADIALYAYTHVAHEGGFDMESYPETGRWLGQIASLPRYISITDTPQ